MAITSLEKLIKSLSRGELKAFSSSINNNNSLDYYKIFVQAKKNGFIDKSSSIHHRKYLYDSILESISKSSNSIDSIILKKLLNTETLYNRQLIKEAWKEVNKAQKLAQKHERFGFLIQILEWKKSIGFYMGEFSRQDHQEISSLQELTLNQQLIFLQTKNKYMEILALKKEIGYLTLNYDKSFFTKYESPIAPESESKRALFYSQMSKAIYHWMLKDHDKEYQITKNIIDNIDIKVDRTEFLIGSLEHLTSCVCNASFNELLETLFSLKTRYEEGYFGFNYSIELKLFYYAANYEIMSYAFQGNALMLNRKIIEVEHGIIKWQKNLSKEMLIIIYSALKMGHYYLGNIKESKMYINKMLTESNKSIRKDAFEDALSFNIISAMDRNDIDYCESTLSKTIRYLNNNNMEESFEFKLATTLKNNLNSKQLFANTFNSLHNDFEQYFYKLKDGRYYSENYLPIYIWLISKIRNKPILEIMKLWHENKL